MFLDKQYIGKKLKEYRKKANFSQEKIAEKTNLAEKHYGRLERGICTPTLETFFKLINALNIPLSEFGLNSMAMQEESIKRKELIKEIYTFNDAEIDLHLTFINALRNYEINKKFINK